MAQQRTVINVMMENLDNKIQKLDYGVVKLLVPQVFIKILRNLILLEEFALHVIIIVLNVQKLVQRHALNVIFLIILFQHQEMVKRVILDIFTKVSVWPHVLMDIGTNRTLNLDHKLAWVIFVKFVLILACGV